MSETANNIQSPIRSNKFGQRLTEFCNLFTRILTFENMHSNGKINEFENDNRNLGKIENVSCMYIIIIENRKFNHFRKVGLCYDCCTSE